MGKKLICVLLMLILSVTFLFTAAFAVTVEQVQVCMPEIDVYLYEGGSDLSGISSSEITAALGAETLSIEEFSVSDEGIFYVYMLDISASMPSDHFVAAKSAVMNAYYRLREQDSLALVSFGNDVTLVLRGGESEKTVVSALDSLNNKDGNTMFYNAMDALIKLVNNADNMRRIAVVISDGIDDTDAGMTQVELENALRQSGVSVNALCISTSSVENVEKFQSFLQISGGELYLFDASNAQQKLDDLLNRLDGSWQLKLLAGNNLISGEPVTLAIDFGGHAQAEIPVTPEKWIPDEKRPRVDKVSYNEDEQAFIVVFSEPVSGADDAKNYVFTNDAGDSTPAASAVKTEDLTYKVYPKDINNSRSLSLTIENIYDISMEKNAVYTYSEVVYSNSLVAPEKETAINTPVIDKEPFIETGAIIVISVIVAVSIAAAVIIFKLSFKKSGTAKKEKPPKEKREKEKSVKPTATFMFVDNSKNNRGR